MGYLLIVRVTTADQSSNPLIWIWSIPDAVSNIPTCKCERRRLLKMDVVVKGREQNPAGRVTCCSRVFNVSVSDEWTELNCTSEAAPEELEEHSMVAHEVQTRPDKDICYFSWQFSCKTWSCVETLNSSDLLRVSCTSLEACWTRPTPSTDVPSGCLTRVSFIMEVHECCNLLCQLILELLPGNTQTQQRELVVTCRLQPPNLWKYSLLLALCFMPLAAHIYTGF